MKNFLVAVFFAVVALGFSVSSAAPVPLSSNSAETVYSELEKSLENEEIPFTLKNFRRDSDAGEGGLKAWTCDLVEKSTGKSDAKIFFTEDESSRLLMVLFICNSEAMEESVLENVVLMMMTLSFGMPVYFGVPDADCQALVEEFMRDPSAGKWSRWDSEHKKLVNIAAGNEKGVVGFYIYATDGE